MAKGNTLYNLKQFEEALLAYKKSIQLAPSGTAYEKMGEVYEQLAQQAYKKAEEFMRAPEL